MSDIILVGSEGRMSKELQSVLTSKRQTFKVFGAPGKKREVNNFKGALGVIDFSLPAATPEILDLALSAKIPVVCGTTGWKDAGLFESVFSQASKKIPIVWDSNFSTGVELICQAAENIAPHASGKVKISDLHHIHKKDSPSGTALKIQKRLLDSNPKLKVEIESFREGENPGEHRIHFSLQGENLELTHRAEMRRIFAEGAFKAFEWIQGQPPGLYSMKDVLS